MPPISLHEWNYGATELESKLTYLLERDKELLGMAVQRSVVLRLQRKSGNWLSFGSMFFTRRIECYERENLRMRG